MTTPHLYACYFGDQPQWARLAAVLKASALEHCRGWDVAVEALPKPPDANRADSYTANVYKLARWCAVADEAPEGLPLLLIDADTAILRGIEAVWDQPFDVAYTTKPAAAQFPFNAGVFFLRVSPGTRAFLRAWLEVNERFMVAPLEHRDWRQRFGGINQAALGYLLAHQGAAGMSLVSLPCAEWNCADEPHSMYDEEVTRVLHVKSELRRMAFSRRRSEIVSRAAARWRAMDERTRSAGPEIPAIGF